jgi:hypothetical protein
MLKRRFSPRKGTRNSFNLVIDVPAFGGIPIDVMTTLLKDGRVFGLIAEQFVLATFANLTGNIEKMGHWDVRDDTGAFWEVRVVTSTGVNLIPSHMIGKGRVYDERAYTEKLHSIKGFILVDIRSLPSIWISSIFSEDCLSPILLKKLTPRTLSVLFGYDV